MLQACTADEYFGLGNEYNSLVTVVVPIYNTEKYLRRCLDSIINQSYSNLEIILIDDGSIDNSSKICYEYSINDHRIKIIRQKNAGVSVARNVGIRNATGQYITFVDSDDYIANDMVEILLHTIRKYNADISMCGMIRTSDKRNNMIDEDNSTVIYTQEEFVKVMLRITGNRIVHYPWGKLYKKEVLSSENQFPPGIKTGEDVISTFKAIIHSKSIVEVRSVKYYYFFNSSSVSNQLFNEDVIMLIRVWEDIFKISELYAPIYIDYVLYNLKRVDFTILCSLILYGNQEIDERFFSEKEIILKRLKKNKLFLLKGSMSFLRKCALIAICCNYELVRDFVRCVKKLNFQYS